MARTVQCVYLKKEADGLKFVPYPGELGKRIYSSVSKEAWASWLKHQTMLVNENRLNLAEEVTLHLARQILAGALVGQVQPVFIDQHRLVLEP